jgi:hypothetical protein
MLSKARTSFFEKKEAKKLLLLNRAGETVAVSIRLMTRPRPNPTASLRAQRSNPSFRAASQKDGLLRCARNDEALSFLCRTGETAPAPDTQKFFASFFQKRSSFFLPPLPR